MKEFPVHGKILISEPFMKDPNFQRSAVLLCDNDSDGSMGLLLGEFTSILLSEIVPINSKLKFSIRHGGPCEPNTLHVLHQYATIPESTQLLPDLYWGGDFNAIIEGINTATVAPSKIAFFLGYAGWSEQQLESEIAQNDWIILPAKAEYVFFEKPRQLWKQVLQDAGGKYAQISNFPKDPRLN